MIVCAQGIVLSAFFRIAQNFVGFLQLFKAPFGRLVILVQVGMVLPSQFTVLRLDFILRGVTRHAQNLIVILVLHRHILGIPLFQSTVAENLRRTSTSVPKQAANTCAPRPAPVRKNCSMMPEIFRESQSGCSVSRFSFFVADPSRFYRPLGRGDLEENGRLSVL
jgi:hypothetical protein